MPFRPIVPRKWKDVVPNEDVGEQPEIRWVEPASLLVDPTYQRDLADSSVTLVRNMIRGWRWTNFKPPIVAETEGGALLVIDGQHTAIAAASHPKVGQIPVVVVSAPTMKEQAEAFVGQNVNRVALTPMAVHYARLASGEEGAVMIDQVCKASKVRILRQSPGQTCKVGDTFAVSGIRNLIKRRGVTGAIRVLDVLVRARSAPVKIHFIRAVEQIAFLPALKNRMTDEQIVAAIRADDEMDLKAKVVAAREDVALYTAVTKVLLACVEGDARDPARAAASR